jgi:hypothetical protein
MCLKKGIGCKGLEWIHQVYDRDLWPAVVKMVMNVWIPRKVGSFLTFGVTVSFLSALCSYCICAPNFHTILANFLIQRKGLQKLCKEFFKGIVLEVTSRLGLEIGSIFINSK